VDNYTGLPVKPGDPAGLALAIAKLLSDRERALALGQAGQACARDRFTVAQMVRRAEEEYIRALTAKGLLAERDGWNLPETGGVQVKK